LKGCVCAPPYQSLIGCNEVRGASLRQSQIKAIISRMSQFDGDRESAISQDTHWHQFFECFTDLMNGSCRRFDGRSVEYHNFPSCIGDFRDHQIGGNKVTIRSQQFFCPIRFMQLKTPAQGNARVDDNCHSSNSSSRPRRMAARTSTSPIGGIIARTFLNTAIFSSGVSGAAFVRTSRSSCSRDRPLSSALVFSLSMTRRDCEPELVP
jgi:hypothetical protein